MKLADASVNLKERLENSDKVVARPQVVRPAIVERKKGAGSRGRAAVVAWDMGHNPVGRAMVIYDLLERDYDVELIGPIWSRYGHDIWAPIRDSGRVMRAFHCERYEDFYPAALVFAEREKYDLVVACKARLPSMILAGMIKRVSQCPMLIDVDDFELSFFKDESSAPLEDLKAAGIEALAEPYEELASRVADGIVKSFDEVVVSNVALRDKFGGYVVRHARDEAAVTELRFNRDEERKRLGIKPDEFALVFVGTARAHKGIFEVADTLEAMGDNRFVLHIVGDINNKSIEDRLGKYKSARIVKHPGCEFDEMPSYIVAADVVPLLQQSDHAIAQYQIPAKISDASALGVPVIATDVPPLVDLHHCGILTVIDTADLGETLMKMYASRDVDAQGNRKQIRRAFESEFGFDVNRERLLKAVDSAELESPELNSSIQELLDFAHDAYVKFSKQNQKSEKRVRYKSGAGSVDMVSFWKQNDTGVYGRRCDMIYRHMLKGGYRNRIITFDAVISLNDLGSLVERGRGPTSHEMIIVRHTVDNILGLSDRRRFLNRTFVYGETFCENSVLAQGVNRDVYPEWVEAKLLEAKFNVEETEAWVFPVVMEFPQVAQKLPFKKIVADIVDDQRAFAMRPEWRRKVERNYELVLPLADTVLTNCEPNVSAFEPIIDNILVVPNGTEIPSGAQGEVDALKDLKRPLVGYVGNLRDRLDWALLEDTARALPNATFAIIGGGARDEDVASIKGLKNVVFTGVVPYSHVQSYISNFDVAIVPHVDNFLTKRMNPLKIYNYFAARKPIVSTKVENIDEFLEPYISFAENSSDFAAAISKALDNPIEVDAAYRKTLKKISWSSRVEDIVGIIDKAV